jgi:hypothetical protein
VSNERAELQFKRREWSDYKTHSFTVEEAEAAQLLGKETWKKHRKDMLWARAVSQVARFFFPDSIKGLYTPDEIGDVIEAQPVWVSTPVTVSEVPAGVEVVVGTDRITDDERGRIMQACRALGMTDEHRQELMTARYGKGSLRADASLPMTRAEAADFLAYLTELSGNGPEAREAPPAQGELVAPSEQECIDAINAAQTLQALTGVMNGIKRQDQTAAVKKRFQERLAAFKTTA